MFSNNDVKLIVSTLTLLIVTTLGSAVAHEDVENVVSGQVEANRGAVFERDYFVTVGDQGS